MAQRLRRHTAPVGNDVNIDYRPPPVVMKFANAPHKYKMLMGPWGSGKTTGCIQEMVRRAMLQDPFPIDNIRRTRWACIRNTYPELKTTTIMTWLHWFPEEYFGQIWWDVPITYIMRFADVEMTIYFLALDRPEHTRKLLSLELTGAFINEAREVPKAVWDDLDGRVGRYPPHKVVPANWVGVLADTNPPDEDHWIPEFFEEETEVPLDESKYKLFKQPSGLSGHADNKENLRPNYYEEMAKGHTQSWIDVYVHGRYGTISGDRRVYTEFDKDRHVSPVPLKANPNLPLYLGFDYGLTPAAVIAQLDNHGTRLVVLKEILATSIAPDGMGIKRFLRTGFREGMQRFSSFELIAFGDPTGNQRAPTDGKAVEDILREEGIPIQGASTNNFITRREAVAEYLDRYNGFIIDPSCKVLIKGFIRGYKYKRTRVQNEDRWTDIVDKVGNHYTHPQDGLQYIAVGITGQIRKNKVKKLMTAAHLARPKHPLYREAETA